MASGRRLLLAAAGAAVIGLLAWLILIASAPTYSHGADEDFGSSAYYWVLLGVALVGGFLLPNEAPVIGAFLGLPGFLLSPWTAPRGDNDGLWLLIVPFLGFFTVLLAAVAYFGSWLRSKAPSVARTDAP